MADGQAGGEFVEGGVRLFFDVRRQFLGIQLAPFSPTGFGGERAGFGGGEIAINRAPGQVEVPCRCDLGTTGLHKFDDPFPQIQRVSFHAHSLSPYVPMSMLIAIPPPPSDIRLFSWYDIMKHR
jgi:hypothetical protein